MTFRKSVLWGFLFSLFVCVENIDGRELDFKTYRLELEGSGEDYRCSLVHSQQEMENSLRKAGSSDDKISELDVDWSKNIALLVTGEKVVPVELFHPEENRVRLRYKIAKPEVFKPEEKKNPDGSSITEGLRSLPRWALLVEFPRLAEVDHYECGLV